MPRTEVGPISLVLSKLKSAARWMENGWYPKKGSPVTLLQEVRESTPAVATLTLVQGNATPWGPRRPGRVPTSHDNGLAHTSTGVRRSSRSRASSGRQRGRPGGEITGRAPPHGGEVHVAGAEHAPEGRVERDSVHPERPGPRGARRRPSRPPRTPTAIGPLSLASGGARGGGPAAKPGQMAAGVRTHSTEC